MRKENGQVVIGDLEYDGRVILYALKGDATNFYFLMKPLVLAVELDCPYVLSIIDPREEWFSKTNPMGWVPAIKDQDPETGREITIFESTACMQYLADRFDKEGLWTGRNAWERAAVSSWTASQTANLGTTAKFWMYFFKGYPSRENPEPPVDVVAKLHELIREQWDILNDRLSSPEQEYIALCDRPTIADLAFFPYAMPQMFSILSVDIGDWPHIRRWADRMLKRPAVATVLLNGPRNGH